MQRPSLVLFDCDGVLVDSEPPAATVLMNYLEELGLSLSLEEVDARYRGRSLRDCVSLIEHELKRPLPPDFIEVLNLRTFDEFRRGLSAIPGVRELIERLVAAQIPLCVASSGSVEKIRFTLGLTDLLRYFDPHLFSASMVQRGKPFPDLFEYGARAMAVPVEQCVVIEDSVPGATGAMAAGMRAIGYAPMGDPLLAGTGAEVARSMCEVADLLGL